MVAHICNTALRTGAGRPAWAQRMTRIGGESREEGEDGEGAPKLSSVLGMAWKEDDVSSNS